MGLFSIVKGITSTVGKTVVSAVVLPTANTISNIIKPNSGKATLESFTSTKTGKTLTYGIGAAATALPVAYIGAGTVAKTLIKNPGKTSIGLIGASVLSTSERSQNVVAKQVSSAPSNLSQFGGNIGKAIDNPTVSNIVAI